MLEVCCVEGLHWGGQTHSCPLCTTLLRSVKGSMWVYALVAAAVSICQGRGRGRGRATCGPSVIDEYQNSEPCASQPPHHTRAAMMAVY